MKSCLFSFNCYAVQILNQTNWKAVFDSIKQKLPASVFKFPLSHKHKFVSFPSDQDTSAKVVFEFKIDKCAFVSRTFHLELTEAQLTIKVQLHRLTSKQARFLVFCNCEEFQSLINLKQLCLDIVRHFYTL